MFQKPSIEGLRAFFMLGPQNYKLLKHLRLMYSNHSNTASEFSLTGTPGSRAGAKLRSVKKAWAVLGDAFGKDSQEDTLQYDDAAFLYFALTPLIFLVYP